MVLKKYKEKSVLKIIEKRLSELAVNVEGKSNKVSSMLVVINFEKTKNLEVFEELMQKLNIRGESYRIIGYLNRIEKEKSYPIPVFNDKTIKRNGEVKDPEIDDVIKRKYDLVISFYDEHNLPLLFMSSIVEADFRVGIGQKSTMYNNLVIDSHLDNYKGFERELIKYLSILNKI
ncbi:DUF6913 domain-containing protein [Zhouia amylolytica]|uniref:Uncharacterized protein n=1 Tax=Zhouia amylolytica AD3 TaxID=1286632 RepID=W2UNX3_9FLAO|nr:hypothetical protein [Zhouia amylolytica]ETN95649.1 hypothetical protein P278_13710 [Zhouia amylolytica AD3]